MSFLKNMFNNKKKVFESDLFQDNVGNTSYTKSDLVPLLTSIAAKDEFKYEQFYNEFLYSYIQAMDILCDVAIKQSHPIPGFSVIYNSSTTLPCLFSGRHVMELSLKWLCYKYNGVWLSDSHSLKQLWNKFSSIYSKDNRQHFDNRVMQNLNSFIEILNDIDSDGFHFRYACLKDGKTFCFNEWKFVNLKQFENLVHEFVEQLKCFEYPNNNESEMII